MEAIMNVIANIKSMFGAERRIPWGSLISDGRRLILFDRKSKSCVFFGTDSESYDEAFEMARGLHISEKILPIERYRELIGIRE